MEANILDKAKKWANDKYFDTQFRETISGLIQNNDEKELTDRFYKDLEFGTGGLRGILGEGSNRMNIYTVRKATQGLADYILEKANKIQQQPSVAIAFDSRNFSKEFSREAAAVFAANNIQVHLFEDMRPVPMLSFAVRELETMAGIVITASHNPPEYNGYKVYWSDGCQVTPPHDTGIIAKVNKISDFSTVKTISFDTALEQKQIQYIAESIDQNYFNRVEALSLGEKNLNRDFGVVYTPLHGTGIYPVRVILESRGFQNVSIVKSQEQPDGNFPTVSSPNPEEPTALKLAMEAAKESDQLIVGTDPDADRIGVMVKHKNTWQKLNGNQIGQLLLEYYLKKLEDNNHSPKQGLFVTTIVTSDLGRRIAENFNIHTEETLTGFKYIGSVIKEIESQKACDFIFGTEESHGYLFSNFVRDKDAVIATMIFCELCAELYAKKLTAIDQLDLIHQKYGYHTDSLVNKVIKGQSGAQQISSIMEHLRKNPLKSLAGTSVINYRDYQSQQIIDCQTGKAIGKTHTPKSNVLAYYLADGSRITARPSGTEPKIKFYFNLRGTNEETLNQTKLAYIEEFNQIIETI